MTRTPVLYLPHGGGPLPLLGDPSHAPLSLFLEGIGKRLGDPAAILIISAHWEEKHPTLTSGGHPSLIYDYYGFPEESYRIKYPALGSPELSTRTAELLVSAGFECRENPERGFDHGMFVPLKLIFPNANIPCVQLSLNRHLNSQWHLQMGKALSSLRKENVLIIGSGLSFHNMQAFNSASNPKLSAEFDLWLAETCTDPSLSISEREQRLVEWETAPQARFCHPREEHLLPLHVCYGAAQSESPIARTVFNDSLMGHRVSGFLWE